MSNRNLKRTPKGTQRRKRLSFYDEISKPYDEVRRRPTIRRKSSSSRLKNQTVNNKKRSHNNKNQTNYLTKRSSRLKSNFNKSRNLSSSISSSKPSFRLSKFYIIAGCFILFCIFFTIVISNCSANISKQDRELNDSMQQIESEYNQNLSNYNQISNQNIAKEAETQSYPKVLSTLSNLSSSNNIVSYSGNKQPSEQNKNKLENEVKNIVDIDNSYLYFCMIDVFTQNCIYYNIDQQNKPYSSIKGPFLSADACQIDGFVDMHEEELFQAIKYSENAPYEMLWSEYGTSYMQNWLNELNISDSLEGIEYPEHFSIRSMTKLWTKMFQEFNHNEKIASFVANFIHTKNSAIDWELGSECLVQTKAGWGDGSEDYTGLNDCGIVNDGSHPYILCIFSGYGETPDKLQNLVRCLHNCHNDLV